MRIDNTIKNLRGSSQADPIVYYLREEI